MTKEASHRRSWIHAAAARIAALWALSALSLAACGGGVEGEPAQATSEAGAFGRLEFGADPIEPPAAGDNSFRVTLRDLASDEPVTGASLDASAVMPAMGHASPEGVVIEEIGDGTYEVTHLVFPMPGRWEVRYRAAKGDLMDEAAFRYEVR